MAYTLGNKYAKNLRARIALLQVIIENVVTCFLGTQCSFSIPNIMAICRRGPPSGACGGVEWRWGRQRISGFAIGNCCTVVSLSHLAARFLLTAGIGRPSATRYKQSPSSVTVYSARPTKCGLALYAVTVVRESCVRLDVTPKTTKQTQIVRTIKSEAEVT